MPSEELKNRRYLFVAGGVGTAPVYPQVKWLHEHGVEVDVIIGAKTASMLIYTEEMERVCSNLYIATDDGSRGFKGMISAKSSKDCEKVIEKVRKLKYRYRNKNKVGFDDCYVMGCASVGKSTFINSVISKYLDGKNFITTSEQYHTTVDIIKIPLDNNSFIIDTPGIISKKSFGYYLNYESMKDLKPSGYLKPKTYQLNSDQTIFIGGLCRLEFYEGENISASFYVSNDLYIHRTKTIKADELWTLQKNKLLVPPYKEEESQKLNDLMICEYYIDSKEKAKDLLIPNVGFVHLSGDNLRVKLYIDKKIKVILEDSFI